MEAHNLDGDRGLSVVNHFTRRGLDDPGRTPARPSQWRAWIERQKPPGKEWQHFVQQCASEWRDFGQQPGTHLWLVRTGIGRRELRTAEQQTVATARYELDAILNGGGPTFTLKGGRTFTRYPGTKSLVDKTGVPILYISGRHYSHTAGARIAFPDRRWLQFPVRGTGPTNAIMTAVDQDSDKVALYRLARNGTSLRKRVEITVHPGHPLTDELVLAIALSAPWLRSYFASEPEVYGSRTRMT